MPALTSRLAHPAPRPAPRSSTATTPGPHLAQGQPRPFNHPVHQIRSTSPPNGPKPMGEATPSAPSFFFLLLGQFSFGPVDVFFVL